MDASKVAVSVCQIVGTSPVAAYSCIADYRAGHPQILPRPPFVSLDVMEGGHGAGTVIRIRMRLLGRETSFDSVVTEPEPGRILEEHNDNGYVTRFIVEPVGTDRSRVTIETLTPARPLGLGAIERWLLRRLLEDVYRRELQLLAGFAGSYAEG